MTDLSAIVSLLMTAVALLSNPAVQADPVMQQQAFSFSTQAMSLATQALNTQVITFGAVAMTSTMPTVPQNPEVVAPSPEPNQNATVQVMSAEPKKINWEEGGRVGRQTTPWPLRGMIYLTTIGVTPDKENIQLNFNAHGVLSSGTVTVEGQDFPMTIEPRGGGVNSVAIALVPLTQPLEAGFYKVPWSARVEAPGFYAETSQTDNLLAP